jgi:hypothetical protein
MGKSIVYYIKLGSGLGGAVAPIKYAFRTQDENYKGLEKELGVIKAKESEKGLVFGANYPKPATVRINFEGGGSTTRFCDPSKLENVTYGGALNKKKVSIPGIFNNRKISSVTTVRG